MQTVDERIKPLQDNIVLEMLTGEKVTKSGIIIPGLGETGDNDTPEMLKGKPLYGKVVAIGPGTYNKKGVLIPVAPEISLGDIVYINKWGGTPIMIDNKKYTVIRENEALFVSDKQY